jgi:hypothetical protein
VSTRIYGYCNCAHFNLRAEGDEVWFSSRSSRDSALAAKRARAVRDGLAPSAAQAGIYSIQNDSAEEVGVRLEDLDVHVEEGGAW